MLIFIAGVHGVGKGYLCKKYVESNQAIHKSASQLIREHGKIELPTSKLTENIDRNQLILLAAVDNLTQNGCILLLDGHFALASKDGTITAIESDVFKGLKPDGVILLQNDIDLITQRINERDGDTIKYNISSLIEEEKNNAKKICSELDIPLKEIYSASITDFSDAIEEIRRESNARA
ncbi:ATP-binding protein [Enterobacter hormaechei]|uniref:ATP-binding protein n=1 Tax=Enterobacter cloacae complex TaxID=354276 RepID=UPI000797D634|nr:MULTISPECIES: ATP-binding protein [Enterobacter cloacae complex]ELX8426875.1 AAA family ATPase [Enterobacter hormaechei subsp. hoffmannii]HBM2720901.1 AAA family ATPase [Enterobacter hormaechei subsp. xiangfangensis]EIY1343570.1 AAA family ATPase [Enterobacter hormaechei]EIY1348438.1 AAA family ATPase [Enterobacter hormaechei]EIY1362808.1 AAA family ATPase [Enterobacter hormaechei]